MPGLMAGHCPICGAGDALDKAEAARADERAKIRDELARAEHALYSVIASFGDEYPARIDALEEVAAMLRTIASGASDAIERGEHDK